jgi:MerR family transcriptional regulator/heat shock protein HspR
MTNSTNRPGRAGRPRLREPDVSVRRKWKAIVKAPSLEIELFDPPADTLCSIETTAQLAGVPRRTILVYCKRRLISPVISAVDRGYSFDREGIRVLRRIEALRAICGDDLAGIKIILELTSELERLHRRLGSLSKEEPFRKAKSKSNQRRKKK